MNFADVLLRIPRTLLRNVRILDTCDYGLNIRGELRIAWPTQRVPPLKPRGWLEWATIQSSVNECYKGECQEKYFSLDRKWRNFS